MTAVLEQDAPAIPDHVRDLIVRTDALVDDFWGPEGEMWQHAGKTCLLGLLGKAIYGHEWKPTYGVFHPSSDMADPRAVELVEHVADAAGCGLDPAYQQVYRYNDDNLNSPEQVHSFLKGILSQ